LEIMQVKDIMTTSPICCGPDDAIERVAALMREHDCGAIPVCAGNALAGVITDRDIVCRAVAGGRLAVTRPVREIMTEPVYTVHQDADVQAAIDTMEVRQVRRLPVVDDDGRVVGIVAPSDLAPIFASTNVADFLLAVSYWSRSPRAAA
jgi:CBS domain-containing protein